MLRTLLYSGTYFPQPTLHYGTYQGERGPITTLVTSGIKSLPVWQDPQDILDNNEKKK